MEIKKNSEEDANWKMPDNKNVLNEIPHLDKLVGISEEDAEEAKKYYMEKAETTGSKQIEGFELKKTEKDIEIINFVEQAVTEEMQQYNRKKAMSIPLANIHILRKGGVKEYTKGRLQEGAHNTRDNSILVEKSNSDIDLAITLFHELFHSKSYKAEQLTIDKGESGNELSSYRGGISVTKRDGSFEFFVDLEEAVIGFMTERFYNNGIKHNPRFSDEVKQKEQKGIVVDTTRMEDVKGLKIIMQAIFNKNQDQFKDKREVADLFIDAQINGNLLKIGKLIDKTFGKGTFRDIGEQTGRFLG